MYRRLKNISNMEGLKVKIDNSDIMRSYESAHYSGTSPTGRKISLYKKNLGKMTEVQKEIFWKFCKNPMVRFIGEVDCTIEEMKQLLEISKL